MEILFKHLDAIGEICTKKGFASAQDVLEIVKGRLVAAEVLADATRNAFAALDAGPFFKILKKPHEIDSVKGALNEWSNHAGRNKYPAGLTQSEKAERVQPGGIDEAPVSNGGKASNERVHNGDNEGWAELDTSPASGDDIGKDQKNEAKPKKAKKAPQKKQMNS